MKISHWFKPGMKIKRWLVLGILGLICISFGLSFFLKYIELNPLANLLPIGLIAAGGVLLVIALNYTVRTIYLAILSGGGKVSMDAGRLSSLLYDKRILIRGPKIVTIGGGTGLSSMLRGLKLYSSNITAIVTVADDGGGSGVLRQDLGMLPPGDIRNCILALANTEPIMEKLLQYRFQEGMLKGQSFGNLFLAAMDGISSNFEEAVRKMSDVLAVTGRVLPVTLDDVRLYAELEDGHVVCGESNIGKHNSFHPGKIKKVFIQPGNAEPLQDVIEAISEADLIVLGPGSLYTSIIPNLLIREVCEAMKDSKALKVYACNIMTQPGETDRYSLYDHIAAIEKHSYKGIIDMCIANNAEIPEELEKKYLDDGAEAVKLDVEKVHKAGIKVICGDFVSIKNNYLRHDSMKLAQSVIDLAVEMVLGNDKKRMVDYYYVKDRLKKQVES
ncbi:MAG: YvcK family protein [Clostridia bacterium]|nr:YvcK family protein [Clostridia bacterium]